jgi:hypothetical protein
MLDPIGAAWNTVARFDDYEAARRAVNQLSDDAHQFSERSLDGELR